MAYNGGERERERGGKKFKLIIFAFDRSAVRLVYDVGIGVLTKISTKQTTKHIIFLFSEENPLRFFSDSKKSKKNFIFFKSKSCET